MTTVPTLLMKGLTEGLILRTVEREPTPADAFLDRFEALLGEPPHANQVAAVLERLANEDRIRADGPSGQGAYRLTQAGAERLQAYRSLPDRFGAQLVELFRIDPVPAATATIREDPAGVGTDLPGREPARSASSADGWVGEVLDDLPREPAIHAPYATVQLDREPAARRWTLRVEHHEPGRYERSGDCALTFLYEAARRLLYAARGPHPTAARSHPVDGLHP